MVSINDRQIDFRSFHNSFKNHQKRNLIVDTWKWSHAYVKYSEYLSHAGHTRKASRISKAAVDNCGKGVGNFYLS